MKYSFVIPGNPCGFIAYAKAKNPKNFKVWNYAKFVRQAAADAGIQVPLLADKDMPLHITTRAYFRDGRHCDPENVHKLVKDALFYKSPGGDKYTAGCYPSPLYDRENPRVEVEICLVEELAA